MDWILNPDPYFVKKTIWIVWIHLKSSFKIKNHFCLNLIEAIFGRCRALYFLVDIGQSYFQLTSVRMTIFGRSWLGYFRPTSTGTIFDDIGLGIFRPLSTRAFFVQCRSRMFLADFGWGYFFGQGWLRFFLADMDRWYFSAYVSQKIAATGTDQKIVYRYSSFVVCFL